MLRIEVNDCVQTHVTTCAKFNVVILCNDIAMMLLHKWSTDIILSYLSRRVVLAWRQFYVVAILQEFPVDFHLS